MDSLIFADKQLTLWLNSFHSAFADLFFYMSTSTIVWIPLFLMLAWLIFAKQGGQGLVTIVFIALIVLFCDQISSSIIKPIFERYRPTHDPILQYMIHTVNGYRGGLYGFCSSHAANTFGVAMFVALVMRHSILSVSLFGWAFVNSYSRIYLGAHFVGDILVGAILGMIIAKIMYEFYLRVALHFFVISHHNKWTLKQGMGKMFGTQEPIVVALTFWLTITLLLIVCKMMMKYDGIAC